jgi:PAS domain S-box-containing protein
MEMQAIGRDITERKRLEEDLQGREREFATLVENSPDIISRLDRDLRFLYVSPIVERVLGVPPQHFIGKTTREVGTPPHDWDAFESSCRQAFQTGEIMDREFSYEGRHYHSRLIPEFGTGSSVDSILCISENTTERRRSERELVQMSVRLLGLQEEERRRIARQLHDVTAQNLFATTINLSRLQSPAVSSEVKDVLAECQTLCEQALQEIRTLSYLLHPPILDEAGLIFALRLVRRWVSNRGIDVGLVVTREFDRLPREVEADLFRIVQESLSNVHRLSGSNTASVRLEKQATQVVVQIRDDGHGMQRDKTRLEADESTLGVGIPGMRHRLRQLGGNLTIESTLGATVAATVPLPAWAPRALRLPITALGSGTHRVAGVRSLRGNG